MSDAENKNSIFDDLRELISGGWIMLFLFGFTICILLTGSLISIFFLKKPDELAEQKLALFKEIISGLIGFISGAYTTMWNNQHFSSSNKEKAKNGKETVEVTSNATEGLKIQEVTIKKDVLKTEEDGK